MTKENQKPCVVMLNRISVAPSRMQLRKRGIISSVGSVANSVSTSQKRHSAEAAQDDTSSVDEDSSAFSTPLRHLPRSPKLHSDENAISVPSRKSLIYKFESTPISTFYKRSSEDGPCAKTKLSPLFQRFHLNSPASTAGNVRKTVGTRPRTTIKQRIVKRNCPIPHRKRSRQTTKCSVDLKIVAVAAPDRSPLSDDRHGSERQQGGPVNGVRRFFKSGSLSRATVIFGRHKVPAASMAKPAHSSCRRPLTQTSLLKTSNLPNKEPLSELDVEPEVVDPVFTVADEEMEPFSPLPSSLNDSRHSCSSSARNSEIEDADKVAELGDDKVFWPIKYSTPVVSSPKSYPRREMTASRPSTRASRTRPDGGKEQMIIDAGQKEIGPILCSECGMLYAANDAEDVALHVRMHKTVESSLKFTGWKVERVLKEFVDGRVILILSEDPKYAQKKAKDVQSVVDQSLGFHRKAQPNRENLKVYLFVSCQKKIVGCVLAEPIQNAYRVFHDDTDKSTERPLCCSTEPVAAVCGINRLWTLASHRRRSIASRLLDCVLQSFYYGCILSKHQLAFSDPTPDGRCFATSYFETPAFLVYK